MRSSEFSIPTERRIKLGVMPRRALSSAEISEWVMLAGWLAKDSVPPSETASLMTSRRSRTAKASVSPPSTSKLNVDPALLHWRSKIVRSGWFSGRNRQVPDGFDSAAPSQEISHFARIGDRGVHSEFHRLQRAHQHPCRLRIAHRSQDRPHPADRIDFGAGTRTASGDQVRMTAHIFGQGRDHQVRAVCERALIKRTKHRVVDDDRRSAIAHLVGDLPRRRQIDETIGRVGWRFDIEDGHGADRLGLFGGRRESLDPALRGKPDRGDAELRQDLLEQEIRSAVYRIGVQEDGSRPNIRPQGGRDGRHARGEDKARLRFIPDRQAIFQHLQIWIVDPAVDEAGFFVRSFLPQAIGQLEEFLAVPRRLEHEGRGMKHGRLQ